MAKMERVREAIHGKLDLDDMQQKYAAGWRLAALEWERESSEREPTVERATGELAQEQSAAREAERGAIRELPFGLRVASDCMHLEEDPTEMRALRTLMELIVQDISMQRMAEELNRAGCTTRDGKPWTAVAIFNVFPRLIEVTPEIFNGEGWKSRRREIGRVMWNS
ncbi:MAG TPA: recombinase family protein [Candidatus Acidoferrales bacterium]|nr:recombinase family protein [Candidatus Acidoferrales bacterium]